VVFSFGNKEKDIPVKNLNKYEKQWKNSGVKNYTQEIIYLRATFPPEHFTMTVKNNIVQNWTTNSMNRTFSEDFIMSLTIENMFKKARESLNTEKNAPLEFIISYDQEFGYITSFSFVPVNKGNISAPLDRGYRIDVTSLKITKEGS